MKPHPDNDEVDDRQARRMCEAADAVLSVITSYMDRPRAPGDPTPTQDRVGTFDPREIESAVRFLRRLGVAIPHCF